MAMQRDFSSPQGVRAWIRICQFPNDKEAATSLNVPFRTFSRWKSSGIPMKTPASKVFGRVILERMRLIIEERTTQQKKDKL